MEEKTVIDLLKTVILQSPGLAAYIFLAWLFMRYLNKRMEFERGMHNEHIYEREQGRLAAQKTAEALRSFSIELQKNMFEMQRNTEANNNLTQTLSRIKFDQLLSRTKAETH